MISSARFECTACGECCKFEPGSTVTVTPDEVHAICDHLGVPRIQVKGHAGRLSLVPGPDGYCQMMDPETKKCRVYEARPAQCRSFPFWPTLVQNDTTWALAARRCEGIGRGELITEEELTARIRQAPPRL